MLEAGQILQYVGFESTLIRLEEDITEQALLDQIGQLNNNELLDGYIVQLRYLKHIDEEKILLAIDSKKDVDGSSANFGRMALELDLSSQQPHLVLYNSGTLSDSYKWTALRGGGTAILLADQ